MVETNKFGFMIRLREKIATKLKRLFSAIFSHSPFALRIREEKKSSDKTILCCERSERKTALHGMGGFFKFFSKKIRNAIGPRGARVAQGSVLSSFFKRQTEPKVQKKTFTSDASKMFYTHPIGRLEPPPPLSHNSVSLSRKSMSPRFFPFFGSGLVRQRFEDLHSDVSD